jgi:ribose-phosphate pyrophosphokinase
MYENNRLKVFSGRANIALAEKIAHHLGDSLGRATLSNFPDGEVSVRIDEDVRGRDVFLVQPTCPPVNENLMELLIMIDSFKRASATRITAVLPYYGYARQDRKDVGRVPISAKLVINEYIRSLNIPASDLVVLSPDEGSIKKALMYQKKLGGTIAIVDKRRSSATETKQANLIGSPVAGRVAVIFDDMISTASSVVGAAHVAKCNGARDIYVCATHGVLCGPAIERLREAPIRQIVVTDSIPVPPNKRLPNLTILSVSRLLADAIERIHYDRSVSELFE